MLFPLGLRMYNQMSDIKPPMNPSHEREQALFILAAAKPVAERAAFLERECGGDKVLRTRLEALLAEHELPEPVMNAPAGQMKSHDENWSFPRTSRTKPSGRKSAATRFLSGWEKAVAA